jgi:hypothetical protein
MMRHVIRFITIFLISLSAQATEKSASDTGRDFYNLLKQENYSAAATYYSPGALQEFRQLMSFENELTGAQKQLFFQEYFEPDLNDESVEKLSDTDFLAAFLHGVISSETFSQMINYKNVDILGEIKEQKDLAHVLTRQWISLGGHKMEIIEVTSFDKVGSEWKVGMTGKLKGVVLMIRQQFLQQ